ncbi:hypothetical protein VOLCADRAFT_100006 [Volvox carteri f. nagariensis]|uniref:Methyltransferase FkbM domain-containing protein n=1 Tax=Volvox carteri f. nagariensis TaxID=3068 RepID=D8UJ62_VOLCA|nr:uncharacterized protein VOLCADRAFT_100006 [Volvox carteri f. nagariensis]EFJ40215.1 hypothetical protein VOLCADRAFT_100006 [Volvox carteri f. nagariensis]|eukprot:XP_002958695.1 hypothetical protein VOLCADRAFT_100006 [Volvox carteri f. nagariensis]
MCKLQTTFLLALFGWLALGLPVAPGAAAVAASASSAAAGPHRRLQTAAATQTKAMQEVCTNTCSKARNGVCEEGRPGKVAANNAPFVMAYCDLGTDCDDCGPWKTSARNISWLTTRNPGPIRFLQSRDVQVRVKAAAVPADIAFSFAYTDPKSDFDVSYHMESSGMVEAGITAITYKLLHERCVKPDGGRALFVDVGANFGWFALLAARLGCRVIAYEPVPLFRSFFEFSVLLNDLSDLIDIRTNVMMSPRTWSTSSIIRPCRPQHPSRQVANRTLPRDMPPLLHTSRDKEAIEVPSVRLEDDVKEDTLLLKIDVEGWEWSVVQGAAAYLAKYDVENVIMEYSPGVPERHFKWDHMAATPAMLITLDNLKYDVEDVKRWQAGTMACPVPPELQQYKLWSLCGGVPEGLNPRSLRSEIGHNTNIWCSKGQGLKFLTLQDVVGILHPNDPTTKYFQTNPMNFGMGSRPCHYLEPDVQVKHRCNCTKLAICGQEQEAAMKAAAEGRISQNYVLP